ncbi:SHOCT domain-containing protein [Microbacterium natoriense]|nr:SHOCT domain-containing protein [Microbacterium natoriense]
MGRPGLLGLAARTAVVAGTATAVSGGMAAHQRRKAQSEYEAAQYEAAQQQAAMSVTPPAPASVSAPADLVVELQRLGDLNTQGLLTDAEFAAAKARLLG